MRDVPLIGYDVLQSLVFNLTSPENLPHDQTQGIHVCLLVGTEAAHVDAPIQDLRRHVPLGPLVGVWWDLLHTGLPGQVLVYGQPKVRQAASHVSLDQDVLGLDVAMGYARFGLVVCSDVCVKVGEAIDD